MKRWSMLAICGRAVRIVLAGTPTGDERHSRLARFVALREKTP